MDAAEQALTWSDFGNLLRHFRLALGLSQEALAERAGLSLNGISALERGARRSPQRATVALLAKALDLGPADRALLEASVRSGRRIAPREDGKSSDLSRHNLPQVLSSFHGRQYERTDLTELLAAHRLVTLTGTAGIGKTRLAIEVASDLIPSYSDGVWFVELAPLTVETFVVSSIAQVLGVREVPNQPLIDTLLLQLKPKAQLLILDNCEHVIKEVARVAQALLRGSPGLRILTTSREPLLIAGERSFRLPSLEVPTAEASGARRAADAHGYAAIALFAERAQAVDHRFLLTDDQVPIVADICRRLDGIPLAIELAAARVSILSSSQIRERLNERFRVLTGSSRDALPRHQTLRAAIDWSYMLLHTDEQILFHRLSIFEGGFSLESVTRVCLADGIDEHSILGLLTSLVDKSVVHVKSGARTRYRLLESMREFALAKLEASDQRFVLAARHARWAADFSEQDVIDAARHAPRKRWLATVEPEMENLRGAIAWSLGTGNSPILAARIAAALSSYWHDCGLFAEGRHWIELALERLGESADECLRAQLWLGQASLRTGANKLEAIQRANAAFERLKDSGHLGLGMYTLGITYHQMADFAKADASFAYALVCLREAGEERSTYYAAALTHRAITVANLGCYDQARQLFSESIDWFKDIDDDDRLALVRLNSSELEIAAGNVHGGLSLILAAIEGLNAFGDTRRDHRNDLYLANAFLTAAACYLLIGEVDSARTSALRALELADRLQFLIYIGIAIQHLATVAAIRMESLIAAQLLGFVDEAYRKQGMKREMTEQKTYEMLMTRLTGDLSPEEINALTTAGSSFDAQYAIATARRC